MVKDGFSLLQNLAKEGIANDTSWFSQFIECFSRLKTTPHAPGNIASQRVLLLTTRVQALSGRLFVAAKDLNRRLRFLYRRRTRVPVSTSVGLWVARRILADKSASVLRANLDR